MCSIETVQYVQRTYKQRLLCRDCLFIGGEEQSGGILVAEEAFYQSLLGKTPSTNSRIISCDSPCKFSLKKQ
jgi:hypothetical protein